MSDYNLMRTAIDIDPYTARKRHGPNYYYAVVDVLRVEYYLKLQQLKKKEITKREFNAFKSLYIEWKYELPRGMIVRLMGYDSVAGSPDDFDLIMDQLSAAQTLQMVFSDV